MQVPNGMYVPRVREGKQSWHHAITWLVLQTLPNASKHIHNSLPACSITEKYTGSKKCQSEFDSDRLDRVAASRVEGYCRWYPVVSASAIFCVDLEGKYRASVYPFLFPERRMNFIVHRLMNISWDRFRREVSLNYDIWYSSVNLRRSSTSVPGLFLSVYLRIQRE